MAVRDTPDAPSSEDKKAPSVAAPTAEEEDDEGKLQAGEKGQAQKDMQAVTGYQEEKGEEVDEVTIAKAVKNLEERHKQLKEKRLKQLKEKESAALGTERTPPNKEHIELIMKEFDITKTVAERHLRENNSDVKATLRKLVC